MVDLSIGEGFRRITVIFAGKQASLRIQIPLLMKKLTGNYIAIFIAALIAVAGFSFGANVSLAYTVTLSTDSNGTISGIIQGLPPTIVPATTGAVITVPDGKSASFIFNATSGYEVAEVLVDAVSFGAVPNYLFGSATAGDHTLSVSFATLAPYPVTATAGANGSVNPSGAISVEVTDSKMFAITPSLGYRIEEVLVDGISQGAVTSYIFPAFPSGTTDHTISASFAQNTYTITANAGENGAVSPSGDISVGGSENKAFVFTPASGYEVADVLVDGISVGAVASYNFINVFANHTIAVSFAAIPVPVVTWTITASAGANGSIAPSGAVSVDDGADAAFTITASGGYHVAEVLVDGISVGAVASHAFTAVVADHTIAVSFAADAPASGGGGGGGSGWDTPPPSYSPPAPSAPVAVAPVATPAEIPAELGGATPPPLPPPPFFSRALSFGARGDEVANIQERLIAEGLLHIAEPTGFFGPMTL